MFLSSKAIPHTLAPASCAALQALRAYHAATAAKLALRNPTRRKAIVRRTAR